jgi:uncharacterized membrane protein
MKQLLAFLVFVLVITSCSIERRHYLPGYHVEWRTSSDKGLVTNDKGLVTNDEGLVTNEFHGADFESEVLLTSEVVDELVVANSKEFSFTPAPSTCTKKTISKSLTNHGPTSHSSLVTSHSPFATGHSPLEADTLKKPFKPQPQYREVDPIGKYAVYTVFVGVALQKLAGMLTWFEVAVPLSFGPAIFIPAVIVALVGLGLSAYSAYRVRKYPEKYKKSEWGKAALAILGWQVLMSALFAWLLL